tara:strand:+ start:288 stop:1427 length:1140 start_codon:yes stop_codon:yes gene_type:complete
MAKVKIQGNAAGSGVFTVTSPVSNTNRTITLPDSTSTLLASDGSGANLTSLPADSTKLPLAGGTLTGALSGTTGAFSGTITANGQAQLNNNNLIGLNTGATSEWIAKRTSSGEGIHISTTNASGADTQRLAITCNADTTNFLIKASNVGIGVTPETWSSDRAAIQLGTSSGGTAAFYSTHDSAGMSENLYNNSGDKYINTSHATQYYQTDGSHVWKVAASGSADAAISWKHSMSIDNDANLSLYHDDSNHSSGDKWIYFRHNGATIGSITQSGTSATAFNTSSDHRLKENVNYTWDATTRLKQLKPARFNFISDDTNTLVDGFLAHEVSSIVPEAISGTKDAVDSDGNVDPQGIDQSKLVPLLVKTIQELEARITALES